jgi:hypothetical protein
MVGSVTDRLRGARDTAGRTRVLQAALAAAVLGFLPVVLLAGALLHAGSFAGSLFDFGIFEHASQRVIVGESPYPDPDALPGEGGYL